MNVIDFLQPFFDSFDEYFVILFHLNVFPQHSFIYILWQISGIGSKLAWLDQQPFDPIDTQCLVDIHVFESDGNVIVIPITFYLVAVSFQCQVNVTIEMSVIILLNASNVVSALQIKGYVVLFRPVPINRPVSTRIQSIPVHIQWLILSIDRLTLYFTNAILIANIILTIYIGLTDP